MDPNVLQEIAQSVKSLGNRQTVGQIIELKKVSFDGSSADAFSKWLLLMDDIYLSIDKDDAQMMFAALKGTALDYFVTTDLTSTRGKPLESK